MRKLGFAGEPDKTQLLAQLDRVTRVDSNRVLTKMAILSSPTITMVDQYTVAAFFTLDTGTIFFSHFPIFNTISNGFDRAGRRGQDIDTLLHGDQILNSEIDTFMTIISQSAASEIFSAWPWIGVYIVHDPAIFSWRTGNR